MSLQPNPQSPSTPQISPAIIAQTVTLSASLPMQMLDTVFFRNTFRAPSLVDEIRFSCGQFEFNPFMYVLAKIKFGADYLTDEFVPVSMLGSVFNRYRRNSWANDTGGNPLLSSEQVWRFGRPLFLDPNDVITIELKLDPTLFPLLATALPGVTTTLPISVALVTRPLPANQPLPKSVCIPWVSHARFGPDNGGFPYGAKTVVSTTPLQLLNNFDIDLKIVSLIGRVFSQYDDALTGTDQINVGATPSGLLLPNRAQGSDANPNLLQNDLTVVLKYSNGFMVIKDSAPFAQIFSTTDNCWFINSVLKPKAFYRATVTADLRNYTLGSLPATFNSPIYAYIALHGYRQRNLRS